ncbi:response regulator [uncultured Bacteroides sp.]|uniref:LytR/AlgR family response regulator transcription factor n=1 Tax=uncultured Bacteroides sp. TaxID=162156 RepID=UPI002AA936FC|nr:response regulator [uncultured Bacteroides sp.]
MKDKFNAIIIDDEEIGIKKLKSSLSNIDKISVNETAQTAQKGKELILTIKPDLLFLDVEMPEMNGLELLRELKDAINWPMQVVFYTAYDKYLLSALRESAFDYLLKPYTGAEFLLVINRFLTYAESKEKELSVADSLSNLFSKDHPFFLIATIRGYKTLKTEDIGYFEYIKERKHWSVTLQNQTRIQLRRNTSADDILNLSSSFTQINQQQIINIAYLSMIEGKRCIMYPPFDKTEELIISRNFAKSVQDSFFMI